MDVRGPADSHEATNKLPQVQRKQLRYELAQAAPNSMTPQFATRAVAPEIVRLSQELKALPEVREELVTQTIAKLNEGYYSKRESAERAASAILSTLSRE